jgi:hypothetical protein
MSDHALLSPSGASRWMACTPSAKLEELLPDSSSDFAREGTLAHAFAELDLRYHFKLVDSEQARNEYQALKADPLFEESMLDYVSDYDSFCINQVAEAKASSKIVAVDIEKKLDLTDYIPGSFGTGDFIVIADTFLRITDLKYGKGVRVNAEENKQMMLYALGALKFYDAIYDIETVEMTIYQPRMQNISTYVMPAKDLLAWAESELKPKALLAFKGDGEFNPGNHCGFCRAKAQCKALAAYNLSLAQHEFRNADLLGDEAISDILSRADLFTSWINAVEDFAFKQALAGKKWPGYKLVEGRSNRMYSDQDKVVEKLKAAGIDESVLYTRSLLGITAMEKAVTKKVFGAVLEGLIIKPQGKPTLVPENDSRQEWRQANSAKSDFSDFVESEDSLL